MMCKNLWKLHASILNCFRVLGLLASEIFKTSWKKSMQRGKRVLNVLGWVWFQTTGNIWKYLFWGVGHESVWFHKAVFEQILLWNPKNHTLIPATFELNQLSQYLISWKTHHLRGVFFCCFVKIGHRPPSVGKPKRRVRHWLPCSQSGGLRKNTTHLQG